MDWLKLVAVTFVVVFFNAQLVFADSSIQKRHLAFQGTLSVDAQNSFSLDLGGDGLIKFKFDQRTKNILAQKRELGRVAGSKISLTHRAKETIIKQSLNLNNSSREATRFSVRNGVIRLGN